VTRWFGAAPAAHSGTAGRCGCVAVFSCVPTPVSGLLTRVAATLRLLYAQPLTRILRLTIDDVLHQDNEVSIRLGDPPSPVPEPFARPAPAAHRPTTQPHHRHQPRRPLAVPRRPWRPAHDPRSHREPLTPAPNLRPSWPDRSDPATHPANTAACYNPDHTARHHDALARLRG
jgi:hypothetical protein